MRISIAGLLLLAACTKSPSNPPASPSEAGNEGSPDTGKSPEPPGLTAATCEAQGGKVIGDIGDGAIHRPDYRCPETGAAPIGSIVADQGGPMGVEGAVCCM